LVERFAWVTTLDKGYEGLHECITFDQIVAIWKEDQE
jgi:hypothetical protein